MRSVAVYINAETSEAHHQSFRLKVYLGHYTTTSNGKHYNGENIGVSRSYKQSPRHDCIRETY